MRRLYIGRSPFPWFGVNRSFGSFWVACLSGGFPFPPVVFGLAAFPVPGGRLRGLLGPKTTAAKGQLTPGKETARGASGRKRNTGYPGEPVFQRQGILGAQAKVPGRVRTSLGPNQNSFPLGGHLPGTRFHPGEFPSLHGKKGFPLGKVSEETEASPLVRVPLYTTKPRGLPLWGKVSRAPKNTRYSPIGESSL